MAERHRESAEGAIMLRIWRFLMMAFNRTRSVRAPLAS